MLCLYPSMIVISSEGGSEIYLDIKISGNGIEFMYNSCQNIFLPSDIETAIHLTTRQQYISSTHMAKGYLDHTKTEYRQPKWPYGLGHNPAHEGQQASLKETSHSQGRQLVAEECKETAQSKLAFTAPSNGYKGQVWYTNMQQCLRGIKAIYCESSFWK